MLNLDALVYFQNILAKYSKNKMLYIAPTKPMGSGSVIMFTR